MKVAVASRNLHRVTGHAGKARHWLLFEVEAGQPPQPCGTVELKTREVFHHTEEGAPHPLDGVAAVIAASCGEGFLRKMERRGIVPAMTRETDPAKAAADFVEGCLAPAKPRPVLGLICKIRDRIPV